jgi:Kef-type K+ transport system membrane component KefB
MGYGIVLAFLFIGFIFGKLVLNQSAKNYDRNLLLLAVVFFVIGSKTVVFATIDFKVVLSNVVPSFLLGVVIRRYINNHLHKRDIS